MQEFFDHQEVRRFFKFLTVAIALLSLLLVSKSLVALRELGESAAAYDTIAVTGHGEVSAPPDIAVFSFTVSQDASTVSEAQNAVTNKADTLIDSLMKLGIAEKDIRTTDYSVYPKYIYAPAVCSSNYCPPSRQIPDGYTVSHSVEVKVRKIADAGEALALAGGKASSISALSFSLDDAEALKSEARDQAVKEARRKAEALAKSLGVSLGRVVDFSDTGYAPVPYAVRNDVGFGGAIEAKAPTIPAGESKAVSDVTITYEIR